MRTQVRPLSLSVRTKPRAVLCPSAPGGAHGRRPKGCAPHLPPCRRGTPRGGRSPVLRAAPTSPRCPSRPLGWAEPVCVCPPPQLPAEAECDFALSRDFYPFWGGCGGECGFFLPASAGAMFCAINGNSAKPPARGGRRWQRCGEWGAPTPGPPMGLSVPPLVLGGGPAPP